MEVVSAHDTVAAAAFTALAANAGNSLFVRNFPDSAQAFIWDMWAQQASAGQIRLHSPRMHDDVQGLIFNVLAATTRGFFPTAARQKVYPNDQLRFEHTNGGVVEVDVGAFLVYYTDLPGVAARLSMWDQIYPNIVNLVTVDTVVAAGAVGDWSAGTVITTTSDLLKADTDYAILGYHSSVASTCVGIQSADTGNLRVGGPGVIEALETRDWFVRLAHDIGGPAIPVFNSNNKGSVLISICNPAGAASNVTLFLAQLAR